MDPPYILIFKIEPWYSDVIIVLLIFKSREFDLFEFVLPGIVIPEQDLVDIRDSNGRHGSYVYDCCKFYLEWHRTSEKIDGSQCSLSILFFP